MCRKDGVDSEALVLVYLGGDHAALLLYPPQVKYKGELKQATAISDPPELKRVKENQKNLSNV